MALTFALTFALAPSAFAAGNASIEAKLRAKELNYTVDSDGDYRITYNFSEENRTQLVFVSGRTEKVRGIEVREIFSAAARVEKDGVDGETALKLMEESRKSILGGWEIGDGVLLYVVRMSDAANADDFETAIQIAAEVADNKEGELSGDRDDL